jgi:isoamylase
VSLHGIFNAYWEPLTFELPAVPRDHDAGRPSVAQWRRCIDTALDSPDDILPWDLAPVVERESYVAQPRSVVLLSLGLQQSGEAAAAGVDQ